MNKIKLMYDIITTMKDKEGVNGDVKVEGTRDGVNILDFENHFAKNAVTGEVTAKIRTEVNWGEHKFKHESTTEFTIPCGQDRFHSMTGAMKCHHPHPQAIPGGYRGKLNRLAFFLKILNDLQVEEKGDGSSQLSLDLTELPEHLKTCMQERLDHDLTRPRQDEQGVLKELLQIENPKITLYLAVNPQHEVERIIFNLCGEEEPSEGGDVHQINVEVIVNLNW